MLSTKRSRKWILALAALTVLAAGMPDPAQAKAKRKIKATIDGKKLKPTKRTVYLSAGGGTIGFLAQAQRISIRGTTKTLMVSCAVYFPGQGYPFTSTDCLTTYSETKGVSTRFWMDLVSPTTSVTFDSYDGTNIAGSFHATVPGGPSNPDLPPVVVDGTFSGKAEQGDPNR
jgi:hypothetical protein